MAFGMPVSPPIRNRKMNPIAYCIGVLLRSIAPLYMVPTSPIIISPTGTDISSVVTICPTRIQSGMPVAVFKTHRLAPRVLMANTNIMKATWEIFYDLQEKNLTMFAQYTAGPWEYIGTQGVIQGTFETLNLHLDLLDIALDQLLIGTLSNLFTFCQNRCLSFPISGIKLNVSFF